MNQIGRRARLCTLALAVVAATATSAVPAMASHEGPDTNTGSRQDFFGTPGAYDFNGFYVPVDNPFIVNVVNAGRSVPVKFSLDGDVIADHPVTSSSHPTFCQPGPVTDLIETLASGSDPLTYDAQSDRYTFAWKTSSEWSGCRRFHLALDDGRVYFADFLFR